MEGMRFWVLGLCLLALSTMGFAGGNAALGKQKSATCAACHGPDGNSSVALWPKLAGQHASYLFQQMQDFKQGKKGGRYNANMTPLMAALQPQDMQDLAAYFASQPRKLGVADKKLVPLGQQLYRGGDVSRGVPACSACHGPRGLGNAQAKFPAVSGQHPEYIVKQLQDYRDGARINGVNDIMSTIAKKMTRSQMKAVASYMSGLH